MLNQPLAAINHTDVTALIGRARESRVTEFKRELDALTGDAKFLKGVSALANTAGGDFVIGVGSNKDGVVDSADGVSLASVDREVTRLSQMLADNLEPRLPSFNIHPVALPNGNHVLVVRVNRSWVGPHRLLRDSKFYARSPAHTYAMDVGELRTAFLALGNGVDRVRSFRDVRLGHISSGNTPVRLPSGGKLVIHILPLPFGVDQQVDVVRATATGTHMPLPPGNQNSNNRVMFNLDGVLNCGMVDASVADRYAQLFRSGAIEGVTQLGVEAGIPYICATTFADVVFNAVRQYVLVMEAIEIPFPVFVAVGLCGSPNYRMKFDRGVGWQFAGPLNGPVIAIPEVAIQNANADIPTALRPILDMIWNAFGFPECWMYDSGGAWRGL